MPTNSSRPCPRRITPSPPITSRGVPVFVGRYEATRKAFHKPYNPLPYDNYSGYLAARSAGKVKLQVEPSPAGQDYYAAVAPLVTSVLTDQTFDPAKALADAAQT